MAMNDGHQWVFGPKHDPQPKQLVGGKGASLFAMSRAGLPVPPFFVISTECCEYFWKNDQTWPAGLTEQVKQSIKHLEQQTASEFGRGSQPLLLAVRSGAAISMPGMMDTILNCGLNPSLAQQMHDADGFWNKYLDFIISFSKTVVGIDLQKIYTAIGTNALLSEEAVRKYLEIYHQQTGRAFPTDPWQLLEESINAVLRSWNSDRALAYRKRNNIDAPNGTAVTVQAMFPSSISGVLFTQDPTNVSAGRILIEASAGLGENVVSGNVTPDRFLVNRKDFHDVEVIPSHDTASLTSKQISHLCEMAMQVEKHMGAPVDIEWGLSDGQYSLLQSRPIRNLESASQAEVLRKKEIKRLKTLASGRRCLWVTHNLSETLRFPTPLTWDIVQDFMSSRGGFGLMYRDFGYRPDKNLNQKGFLELIFGRIYSDADRQAKFFWGELPLSYDLEAVKKDPQELDRPPANFDPNNIKPDFLIKLPGIVWSLIRRWRVMKRRAKNARDIFENKVLPPYLDYVRLQRQRDLSKLTTSEMLDELDSRCRRVLNEFGAESLKCGFLGGIELDRLTKLLIQLGGKTDGSSLSSSIAATLTDGFSLEQEQLLQKVATGQAKLEEFREQFGHRCVNEMELSQPRWREDSAYVNQLIEQWKSASSSPTEILQRNQQKREAIEKGLRETLAEWGGSSFTEQLERLIANARKLLPYRERGRYYLMMGYELIRMAILELARRFDLGDSIFFLKRAELARLEADREELLEMIASRKRQWQAFRKLNLPEVIDSRELNENLGLTSLYDSADTLEASSISNGLASGPARIVMDPSEAGNMEKGYILVCPSTDPGWAPLLINAVGLIVERGGVLSHGAIVAREFGIPAVVCAGATKLIPDGANINLDGNEGKIVFKESK